MSQLIAYVLDGYTLNIQPAPQERPWMDAADHRHDHHGLPLDVANAYGWEILCVAGFTACWDGGDGVDAITITPDPGRAPPAVSHFGYGVLTFHVPCLFRTDASVDLFVGGPINRPKDGISALTGIIETDWAPYTFTMNWAFTRPGVEIRFDQGEPFCHIFPIARGELEAVAPQIRNLSEAPELEERHKRWAQARSRFSAELQRPRGRDAGP